MEAKLFENGNEICLVRVLDYTPPTRERIRVDQMGGGPTFVNGRVNSGTIRISSPIPISRDYSYSIEINQKVMKLELVKITTRIVSGQGGVCVGQGFVY